MDAFFFIDKPTGRTSFDILRDMRRILSVRKIGHTGTLDPLATGGLLVATGNYTKLIPFFEKDTKLYRATISLDGTSDSYDVDTPVRYASESALFQAKEIYTQEVLESIFRDNFSGDILQVPPKYSALKIGGKTALERTKAGEELEMKQRSAYIYSSKILSYKFPVLEIELTVSAGTYIRSIAHDLGNLIGTGGYLKALRRTGVGNLEEISLTPLVDLSVSKALNVAQMFPGRVYEMDDEVLFQRLQNGQRVRGEYDFPESEYILLARAGEIRYVVEYIQGVLHPRKCIIPTEQKK